MAIISDIIDGNTATYSEEGWQGLNRIFVISGIESAQPHAMLYDAMMILAANGVYIGSLHPTIITAQVQSIGLDSISGNQVRLSVVYNEVGNYPVQYSIAANSVMEETSEYYDPADNKTKPLILTYTYPDDYPIEGWAGKAVKQGAIINKSVSEFSLSIKRRESIPLSSEIGQYGYALTGVVLTKRNIKFVGKANNELWTLFGVTNIKRSWICTSISSESVGRSSYAGGWVFDVTYTFSGRQSRTAVAYTAPATPVNVTVYGWDVLVSFIDPNTGQPADPETVVNGVGLKNCQQHVEEDFNLLELS